MMRIVLALNEGCFVAACELLVLWLETRDLISCSPRWLAAAPSRLSHRGQLIVERASQPTDPPYQTLRTGSPNLNTAMNH